MNDRIEIATHNLAKAMCDLVKAEEKFDSASRARSRAYQAVRDANEEIRTIRDEINNPVPA